MFFPSKIGGRPAWLAPPPPSLLEGADLQCERCGKRCGFLAQVYTGGSSDRADAFHSTVFLFCCNTPRYGSWRRC